MHCEVPLCRSKTSKCVSAQGSLPRGISRGGVGGWIDKCHRIERFAARKLCSVQVQGLSRNDVRAHVRKQTGVEREEVQILNVHRWCRPRQQEVFCRPITKKNRRNTNML